MNKKRLLSLLLAAVFVVCAVGLGLYSYDRQKRFECYEKNSFAMGTIVSQKVYAPYGAKHIEKVNLLTSAIENIISRNIDSSEVSTLNSSSEVQSKEVAELMANCQKLTEETKGAFDVTVGAVVDLWAFGEDNQGVPSEDELKEALSQVGSDKVTVNGEKITLSSEAQVDFGAVGKGLACDSAIAYYKAVGDCEGAIISVGGSIGCFGRFNKQGDKWRIAIRHPREENAFLGIINLDEGFVSTSGDYEKYFMEDDIRYHHILDARTGYPASSGLISVTVVCDSGFLSDALSTACFILGKDEGAKLLEKYNASAIFVDEEMNVTTVGEIDFEKQ